MQVAVDSSVLVALLDPRDHWRDRSLALERALLDAGVTPIYIDCVAAEAVSAAVRRLHEKGRGAEVPKLLHTPNERVPPKRLTWILPDVPDVYRGALALMRASRGELTFNDALIALACRKRTIPTIASFDADFDTIEWLTRLESPEDVSRAMMHGRSPTQYT